MQSNCLVANNIEIRQILLDGIDESLLDDYALLYCKIWREAPWLETHWTIDGVKKDLLDLLAINGCICFVALAVSAGRQSQLSGFTIGYPVQCEDMRKISNSKKLDGLFRVGSRTFYIDELGVDSAFRGHSLGKSLSGQLLDAAKSNGSNQAILRTDKRAMPARALYSRLGFEELAVDDAVETDRNYWHMLLQ